MYITTLILNCDVSAVECFLAKHIQCRHFNEGQVAVRYLSIPNPVSCLWACTGIFWFVCGSSVIHLCVCASMCSQYVHICVSAHMCECKDFTQFDLSSLISSGEETSSIHQVAIPEGDPTAELAKRPSSSSSLRACQKSLSAPSSTYLATRSFSLTSTRTVPLFSPTKTQSSANFLD